MRAARDAGESRPAIAARFGVSYTAAYNATMGHGAPAQRAQVAKIRATNEATQAAIATLDDWDRYREMYGNKHPEDTRERGNDGQIPD